MSLQESRALIAAPFQPIAVASVGQRLKLTVRGREDGAKDIPPSDAVRTSATELDIIGDLGAHRARTLESLAAHLRATNDRLAQLTTQMDIARMRQDKDRAVAEFATIRHDVETDLAEKYGTLRELRVEFEGFRGVHNLSRPPRIVKNAIWKIAFILFAVLVESGFNGLLFAAGSDNGIIGGVVIAFGLSFINVVVFGFLIGGFGLRYARHARLLIRAPTIMVLAAVIMALLGFNLLVAHLRDSYAAADGPVDFSLVVGNMIATPLRLGSLESALLLVLGIFCGCLGAYDFFLLNDPYPGYAAMGKRLRAALRDHAEARRALLDDATETRDTLLQNLETAMQALRGAAAQRMQALGTRQRFIAAFEAHEHDIEQAANQLIAQYRDANIAARRTPPPAYFQQRYVLPDRGLEHTTITSLLVEPPAPPDANTLVEELSGLRTDALKAFADTLAFLPAEAS